MGAVQIDQPVPQFLEQPKGHRRSVEKLSPGAGGADLPLDYQGPIGIRLHALFLQPGLKLLGATQLSLHQTAFRTGPHQTLVRPLAQQQQERVNQDGLAGPGLARQDVESLSRLPLHRFQHRQIFDPQTPQHGGKVEGRRPLGDREF